MATEPLPPPVRFLALAWRAARRVPSVWLGRAVLEVASNAFRFAFVFAFGLSLVVHFGTHVRSGLRPQDWPSAVVETALQPGVIVGFGGTAFVAWLTMFAIESVVFGGMWSATRSAVLSDEPLRWRNVWHGACDSFPRALSIRLLVRATEAALAAMIVGNLILFAACANAVGGWAGSPIVAKSATWAALLTVGVCCAAVLRLTTELVAAAVYVDDVSLGEGILRAATTVLGRPVYIYRLFIIAAAVLIPPLAVAWAAALAQNLLLLSPGTEAIAWVFQLAAELAIMLGIAGFSVMLHATFFTYYAWDHHRIERSAVPHFKSKPAIGLPDLLPDRYDHVVDVDEILRPWTSDEVLQIEHDPDAVAPPAHSPPSGPFDLGAILGGTEEE